MSNMFDNELADARSIEGGIHNLPSDKFIHSILLDASAPELMSIGERSARDVSRCVLVVGMHRSGTSSVCGALAQLGLQRALRELPPQPDNPKGFFEPKTIVDLHDKLLVELGTTWNSWMPLPGGWMEREIVKEFSEKLKQAFTDEFPIPGTPFLKDPRLCLFLPLWRKILPALEMKPLVVIVFRHPIEVAQSLNKRNNLAEKVGLLIWLRYIVDSERESRDEDRLFIHYDAAPLSIHELGSTLNSYFIKTLDISDSADWKFFDTALRHHDLNFEYLSDNISFTWYRDAYEALMDLRGDPRDVAAIEKLDRIYTAFDIALTSFEPFLLKQL